MVLQGSSLQATSLLAIFLKETSLQVPSLLVAS